MKFETVIGLEVHAQLLTNTKLFCSCAVMTGGIPNEYVCPVCLALPGTLPVLNEKALRLAVRAALALGLNIVNKSLFARKHYFYPDSPKNYQITQFDQPYSTSGQLEFEINGELKRAGITRIHIEEDAGKNVHGVGSDSAVDLNRAGTPLIEIVGEPDLRSSTEAIAYMKALREILVYAMVNDGNMEDGSFRCDANVSVRLTGEVKFGTRVELKNINSFRFVQKAIDTEVKRQIAIIEDGGRVVQETRGYNSENNSTYQLRSKENAHDYRYFTDPDLPPITISDYLVKEELSKIPELPASVRKRWVLDDGLSKQSAQVLTQHPFYTTFSEDVRKENINISFVKISNFIQNEVIKKSVIVNNKIRFTVSPKQVSDLLSLIESGKISNKQARDIFLEIENTETSPINIVSNSKDDVDSNQIIEDIIIDLINCNKKQADDLRSGKKQLASFFIGQVMKRTNGKSDPKLISNILDRIIGI